MSSFEYNMELGSFSLIMMCCGRLLSVGLDDTDRRCQYAVNNVTVSGRLHHKLSLKL